MALTRFPIETTNPKIEVTLPIGRHVLELVVEDSAGLRSAPDQIVIEVRKEAAVPVVTGILPASALRGATLEAVISGANLAGATEVTFSGTGVTASIGSGGTAASLPVKISITADAATGARSFTVRTPAGTAGSPAGVTLTVSPLEPRIIEPRVIEPRVIAQPIGVEPRLVAPQPIVFDPTPIAEPRAVIAEPRAVIAEPRAVIAEPRAVIAEPRAVIAEPRAVIAEPRAVIAEPRAVIVDVGRTTTPVERVVTPGKAATTTKKSTAAKKPSTTSKKK